MSLNTFSCVEGNPNKIHLLVLNKHQSENSEFEYSTNPDEADYPPLLDLHCLQSKLCNHNMIKSGRFF